ncbi:8852_t:CDS:2 [Cetraspora pellucida]|uniref:8852_t:CDS:1 n=1 Tax=Cetraspora pellucida TaxID=1433469 RepID=A0A9N9BBN1_9GLOM|nr:8852_t:CDS:2 [Cetraspora pellucida]
MAPYLPPECLQEIFNNLVDDFQTLHSIIFVNKLWCATGIRILWRKPFSYDNEWNNLYKIIPIYLSFLSKEIKIQHELQEVLISTKPFFNYVSYIRELDLYSLLMQLCEWMVKSKFISTRPRILTESDDFEEEDPIMRLICQDMTEKVSLKRNMYIIKEIIMIIVEKSPKIDYLEMTMGNMDGIVFDYLDSEYFSDIFNDISSEWFTKISKLEYDGRYLFKKFTEHANNIKKLSFGFHTFTPDLIPKLSQNSNLERLQLRNVEFTVHDYDNFSIDIKFSKLISLELFDVRMASQYPEKSLVYLIEQMMKSSKLISLDLEPYIGVKYDKLLEFIPCHCANLTEITLKINEAYEETMKTILKILPNLNKLRILRITEDWGGIQLDGGKYIDKLILPNQLQFFNVTGLLFSDECLKIFFEKCCSDLKQVVLLLKNYNVKHEQIIKSFSLEKKKDIEDIIVSIDNKSEITINWR